MSAASVGGAAARPTGRPARWPRATVVSYALLVVYGLLLVALSWHRWGAPVNDVGLDLGVAQRWLHGALPYRDVRYWYGPLGIGVIAAAFAMFGASLFVAACVGFAQTIVIAELTRRIARTWLPAPAAAAVVAVVLSIGFSGSLFNFVLPHTFAATMGTATLLGVILALTNRRWFVAGLCVGLAALTRPEFLAFGVAAVAGAALGAVREEGWKPALRGAVSGAVGTVVVAGPVLAFFAAKAGLHKVLLENIFPVEFLRVSGSTFEHDRHPFDLTSFGTLLLRGVVITAAVLVFFVLWALVVDRARDGRSVAERLRLQPVRVVAIGVGAAVLAMLLAVVGGDAHQPIDLTKSDTTRFLIPMTALPAVALATA
ncbi:MAG: hypothetical protein REI11_05030, partial [Patulibacter sp.]|nr:hypothetical protein [Patulibacter sp.]